MSRPTRRNLITYFTWYRKHVKSMRQKAHRSEQLVQNLCRLFSPAAPLSTAVNRRTIKSSFNYLWLHLAFDHCANTSVYVDTFVPCWNKHICDRPNLIWRTWLLLPGPAAIRQSTCIHSAASVDLQPIHWSWPYHFWGLYRVISSVDRTEFCQDVKANKRIFFHVSSGFCYQPTINTLNVN